MVHALKIKNPGEIRRQLLLGRICLDMKGVKEGEEDNLSQALDATSQESHLGEDWVHLVPTSSQNPGSRPPWELRHGIGRLGLSRGLTRNVTVVISTPTHLSACLNSS